MGRLVPAGTGMQYYRNVEVENAFEGMETEEELEQKAPAAVKGRLTSACLVPFQLIRCNTIEVCSPFS